MNNVQSNIEHYYAKNYKTLLKLGMVCLPFRNNTIA